MSQFLRCPVTALKFYSGIVFAGEGSHVRCFQENSLVWSVKAFQISGIHKFSEVCSNDDGNRFMCVIGGKSVRVLQLASQQRSLDLPRWLCEETKFVDWIWDSSWLSRKLDLQLCFISAHNTVLFWKIGEERPKVIASCDDQCILYSATFDKGSDGDLPVVAAGTVFNHVVLWKPVYDVHHPHQFVHPWKRFVGHEGVIFRIAFHPSVDQLLSVSDDRSVRLWSINDSACLRVMYGHSARVWDACYIGENVVSIGEDSVCIVWNGDGNVVNKFCGHKGKSIWSVAVSSEEEGRIFTGGGDGGIREWSLKGEGYLSSQLEQDRSLPKYVADGLRAESNVEIHDDFPRLLKLLDNNHMLVFTNKGRLLLNSLNENTWSLITCDEAFQSYSTLAFHRDARIVALGNLHGHVKFLKLDASKEELNLRIFSGKVRSLIWLTHSRHAATITLVACGPDGALCLLLMDCGDVGFAVRSTVAAVLPYSHKRCVTSAVLLGSLWCKPCDDDGGVTFPHSTLVVGDKRGSLHVYNLNGKFKDPVQSLISMHGKTGVTDIVLHDGVVWSTGRDGYLRKFEVSDDMKLRECEKHRVVKGMDWIEGVYFSKNGDCVVFGFYKQSYFAAWNVSRSQMLFKIKCGGGYRSWDMLFADESSSAVCGSSAGLFAYLKGAAIKTSAVLVSPNRHGRIIQEKLHGREINHVEVIGRGIGPSSWLLATCSEDTDVMITLYDSEENSLKRISVLSSHIGAVKHVTFVPLLTSAFPTGRLEGLLISCGSRSSLICSKVEYSDARQLGGLKVRSLSDGVSHPSGGLDSPCQSLACDKTSSVPSSGHVEFACSLLAEICNPERPRRKSELARSQVTEDMRFMSCSAFSLRELGPGRGLENVYCIVTACSDGYSRVYVLKGSVIYPLCRLDFHKRCVLRVWHHIVGSADEDSGSGLPEANASRSISRSVLVFTAATDGTIAIWDLSPALRWFASAYMDVAKKAPGTEDVTRDCPSEPVACDIRLILDSILDSVIETESLDLSSAPVNATSHLAWESSPSSGDELHEDDTTQIVRANAKARSFRDLINNLYPQSIVPLLSSHVHQSGVNALHVWSGDSNRICVLSGGDDNALTMTQIIIQEPRLNLALTIVKQFSLLDAHVSSVTGVRMLDASTCISTSIDQRIKFWRVDQSAGSFALLRVIYTDVADVSSMECWRDGKQLFVAVAGVGFHICPVDTSSLSNR